MAERRAVRHLERVDWNPHPFSPPDVEVVQNWKSFLEAPSLPAHLLGD